MKTEELKSKAPVKAALTKGKPADPVFLLSGGDRRSIGQVERAVSLMRNNPAAIDKVVECLLNESAAVRMRAADALEKLSAIDPAPLNRYADFFLNEVADLPQQEIRWHMAQMLPRLSLGASQRRLAAKHFVLYLDDRSSIVRTWAMNALAELSQSDPSIRKQVQKILKNALDSGTPAMKARARKILACRQVAMKP